MSQELLDLAVLERKKYNDLNEVLDLTRQLGEALDRDDAVSARMLVALRSDPIRRLEEVDRAARERRAALPDDLRDRLEALLHGSPARGGEESAFVEQAAKARGLLERVVELDRKVSLRMGGPDSFYYQK